MPTGRAALVVTAGAVAAEAALVHLGRTYGSTRAERATRLAGDEIVPNPVVMTNHAITIDASPEFVWPWVVQMGWGRAGWYTARWVDRLLFPANRPSADFVMGRDHLHGIKRRAEALARAAGGHASRSSATGSAVSRQRVRSLL